jgi:type-F conjugative transfer system pilin assembly protein TrbC
MLGDSMSYQTILHRRGFRRLLLVVLITMGLLGMVEDRAGAAEPEEISPHLYVFISSSLPMVSLIAIAKDAAELDAPLIIRGLVGSSLQETLLSLKDLVAEGAGLEVDPLPFEAYGVEAVPAVVLTCGNRNEGPFAIVYGLDASQALPYLRKALPRC